MALHASRRFLFRLTRSLRAGGADDKKPKWCLPEKDYHKYTFQPTIPDKHFNVGHFQYAPITLWLRARRPTMEKIGSETWQSLKDMVNMVVVPVTNSFDHHLPGFGYKILGFLGALIGYNLSVMYWIDRTEAYMNLDKLHLYSCGNDMAKKKFFRTESEEDEARMQEFNTQSLRLEKLWDSALEEATEKRSFNTLISHLEVDENNLEVEAPVDPVAWRFNMMPYGRHNNDTKTVSLSEKDRRADSNYFLLDVGSTGDYCDRQDNKANPIRFARHMYTSAFLPPTK